MFSFSTVFYTELIKVGIGLALGAILFLIRKAIIKRYQNTMTLLKNAKEGIDLLASDEFKQLPGAIQDLISRVTKLEAFIGPNGGKSILDGINSLRDSVSALHAKDNHLTDAAGILMWKADSHGDFTWASEALQELTGYTYEEGFKGQQWENLFFPEDFPNIKRRWHEAVETAKGHMAGQERPIESESILSMRTRFKHKKTGNAIPVYFRAILLPDGTITAIVRNLSNRLERRHDDVDVPLD